jgi:hypothetical protein
MGDDRHVTDVGRTVHEGPDLIYGEVTVVAIVVNDDKRQIIVVSKPGNRWVNAATYTMISRFY